MLRKRISILLLLMGLMTSLAGCGMNWTDDLVREYEEMKDGIISELHEMKDGIKKEFGDWIDSMSQYGY